MLTKEKLAALRQRHDVVEALRAADGTVLALRLFTEEEALRYLEKRAAATTPVERDRGDYEDDGQEELLAAVVYPETSEGRPDVEAVRRFLADWPAFAVVELGGLARSMGAAKILPAELPAEIKAQHPRALAFQVDGQVLALRRLSAMEFRFLEREGGDYRVPAAALAAAARAHLLQPEPEAAAQLFRRYPFLSHTLGIVLHAAAGQRAERFEGE
jgi:hypothetical protein